MEEESKIGRQECTEANGGFGKEPKKDCEVCEGKGFYYEYNWAKTCICKSL